MVSDLPIEYCRHEQLYSVCEVLGTEPRGLCMPDRCSTEEAAFTAFKWLSVPYVSSILPIVLSSREQ